MKFFNGLIAFVFIGIPAILWWAEIWTTGSTAQEKVKDVTANLEINRLLEDVGTHQDLIDAYNAKEISRSQYIREMEKLKNKVERKGKKSKKQIEKGLK